MDSKFENLKQIIKRYESVLVAFSGGIDSALVLEVALGVLGRDRVRAVTADSESMPRRELEFARQMASTLQVSHEVIATRELENEQYLKNPKNRCYFCKSELYQKLSLRARELRLHTICNGTNCDDLGDVRPGNDAAHEYDVKSPLVEAKLSKDEVRALAQKLGIAIWNKPASPCLSSRIPYGEYVSSEKLAQIEEGENFLKDLGFQIVRLRHFGNKARLELGTAEFTRVMDVDLRNKITKKILSLGFRSIFFEPYKMGCLNEEQGLLRV